MNFRYKHAVPELAFIIIATCAVTLMMTMMMGTLLLDAQVNSEGTLVIWRINNAIPNEEMEIIIYNGSVFVNYKVKTGLASALKVHPHDPDIYYFDFNRQLSVNLTENQMVTMCVRPWTDYGSGKIQFRYSCTETFVTKNMARGIMYYNWNWLNNAEPEPAFMRY